VKTRLALQGLGFTKATLPMRQDFPLSYITQNPQRNKTPDDETKPKFWELKKKFNIQTLMFLAWVQIQE
jgi:hypothetical protein